MSFNMVDLMNSEQLMTIIKQSGNEEIIRILGDKNINGQELVELTELKIMSWGLSSTEKKVLFTFINNLKLNQSKPQRKCIPTNVPKCNTEVTKGIPINSMNFVQRQKTQETLKSINENSPATNIPGMDQAFFQELNTLLSRKCCSSGQPRPQSKPPVEDIPITRKISPSTPRRLANSLGDLVQELYQVVCIPSACTKQKFANCVNDCEDNSYSAPSANGEYYKGTKIPLPVVDPVNNGKISSEPSLPQSPQNASEVYPLANRKPIPLPTRRYIGSLSEYLDEAVCEHLPFSEQKCIEQIVENKKRIESNTTGKYSKSGMLRSDWLQNSKRLPSPSEITDSKIAVEDEFPMEMKYQPRDDVDDQGYLKFCQLPVDSNPKTNHADENEVKNSQEHHAFSSNISKGIKEKAVYRKVTDWVVQDHSHLSLIITPSSSEDELFFEEQVEVNESISIKKRTTM